MTLRDAASAPDVDVTTEIRDRTRTVSDDVIQLVGFRLGDEEYGVPITDVQEIIRLRTVTVTRVPNAPEFVEGVINLRGRMVPVLDLRGRFGLEAHERGRESRVVVVRVQGRTFGVVVDAVTEVVRVAADQFEELPELALGAGAEYVNSVARVDGRMVITVDLARVLSAQQAAALGDVAEGKEGGDPS